jgi:hypothetical protein
MVIRNFRNISLAQNIEVISFPNEIVKNACIYVAMQDVCVCVVLLYTSVVGNILVQH